MGWLLNNMVMLWSAYHHAWHFLFVYMYFVNQYIHALRHPYMGYISL